MEVKVKRVGAAGASGRPSPGSSGTLPGSDLNPRESSQKQLHRDFCTHPCPSGEAWGRVGERLAHPGLRKHSNTLSCRPAEVTFQVFHFPFLLQICSQGVPALFPLLTFLLGPCLCCAASNRHALRKPGQLCSQPRGRRMQAVGPDWPAAAYPQPRGTRDGGNQASGGSPTVSSDTLTTKASSNIL